MSKSEPCKPIEKGGFGGEVPKTIPFGKGPRLFPQWSFLVLFEINRKFCGISKSICTKSIQYFRIFTDK